MEAVGRLKDNEIKPDSTFNTTYTASEARLSVTLLIHHLPLRRLPAKEDRQDDHDDGKDEEFLPVVLDEVAGLGLG